MTTLCNAALLIVLLDVVLAEAARVACFGGLAGPAGNSMASRSVAVDNEVGVVHSTAQRSEQVEDVGVIVQDCALRYIGTEIHLALPVNALVEVSLLSRKLVLPDGDLQWRQLQVTLLLLLGAPEQHFLENFFTQPLEGFNTCPDVSILDDRSGDLALEVRVVEHAIVSASRAMTLTHESATLALTTFCLAVVEGVRSELQEAHQGVQLTDAILQGRSSHAPAEPHWHGPQCVRCLCCTVSAAFDAVSFI
mmetsp:Transcript_85171/g.155225  ORF Transcript_85171/g.155225 Transcript_85171/m.155225 type:complete len:250 (+) Transcript_85171:1273-2022(+)